MEPSIKVTVPVGAPKAPVKVAVKVTVSPYVEGLGVPVNVIVGVLLNAYAGPDDAITSPIRINSVIYPVFLILRPLRVTRITTVNPVLLPVFKRLESR